LGVFATLPVALVFPFAGVLLWAWISFMSPHREAFGLAYDFPFNFYVAAVTLVAWIVSQEPKRLPNQALPILFVAFAILISVTTYFALDYNFSYERWDKHIRTMVLVLVVMAMANSRLRIQAFLWMMAISIGYYAAKGGGYTLTGGGGRIFGPAESLIADNNDLALAIIMTIPILNYLRITSVNPIVKLACLMVTLLSVAAVVGTGSRGGFIGLVVVAVCFIVFARPKFGAFLIPIALAAGVWAYAPQSWWARIGTISEFSTDESAGNRFAAWRTSVAVALDRPLVGGGFSAIETDKVDFRYNKADWRANKAQQEKSRTRAAHSIWFQVLGDHGFLGLAIFIGIIAAAFFNLLRTIALTRDRPELDWARVLARGLLVTFLGYLAAGTFLSMAYYDAFLCLVALTASLRQIAVNALEDRGIPAEIAPEDNDALVPSWRTAKAD
jgi:putative inorganic carbon (HCO3(-)) transporter